MALDVLAPEPLEDDEEGLGALRSVKRFVEPLLAPRLEAGELAIVPGAPLDEDTLAELLEEVIVTEVELFAVVEDDEELSVDDDDEPPNTLAEDDIALRDDIRLPP